MLDALVSFLFDAGAQVGQLLVLCLASLLAGFIDAIVGGGGLILLPALFSLYPQALPATLLGSNKGASICGTSWALMQYARRVTLDWQTLAPACVTALVGGVTGAWAVTLVSPEGLRQLLPFVLFGVLVYTLVHKDLGQTHAPRYAGRKQTWVASAIGLTIGFYDGFFGPGTGSFFVFLFVRCLGYDFLHASASAKLLNTVTNLSALSLFALKGHVWWQVVALMGGANVLGSVLGAWLALRHGSGFVRWVFVAVVSALIAKTGWDGLGLSI